MKKDRIKHQEIIKIILEEKIEKKPTIKNTDFLAYAKKLDKKNKE